MERHYPAENQPDPENATALVESIYDECRDNVDLYDSPAGIEVRIGDVVWAVTYWPAWDDQPDRLTMTRDTTEIVCPASYHFFHDGRITKNEAVAKRVPGGVFFEPEADTLVTDTDEIEMLRAIVMATHVVHRRARE